MNDRPVDPGQPWPPQPAGTPAPPSYPPAPPPAYWSGQPVAWGAPPVRWGAQSPWSPPRPVAPVRWAGTIAVAAVISAVVLGGLAADAAIAAPSAGTVTVSGPVTMTAAPGWVLSSTAGNITDGVALQDSNALLVAQVLSTNYDGGDQALLTASEADFQSSGEFNFGTARRVTLGGRQASEVTFTALVSSAGSSGVIDGELVCLVLPSGGQRYAVLIQVGVPQGELGSVTDAVDAMAASLAVAP